ncbi:MAG TPA: hypothetical protein DCQ30_05440 [Acidimicrobiaceae bacterium]|nr:hypothetical protein [Acidimicrobiaceae bacterium]
MSSSGRRLGAVLVIGILGSLAGVVPSAATTFTPQVGVPLPAAWEICVLQSVGAPVTQANVAALDLWQVAEGGSTDNANSYNPYNTKRFTDTTGAQLPSTPMPNGFPAFANWPAGCSATAATILQPNMANIHAWLVAGNIPSPSAFLSIVDTTPWCAPDNGVPCYALLIAANVQAPAQSPAMTMISTSNNDVTAYAQAVAQATSLSATLASQRQELVDAENTVIADQRTADAAQAKLRELAIYDYTSNSSLDRVANLTQFEAETQTDQLTKFYEQLDTSDQVTVFAQAQATLGQAVAHRGDVANAVAQTTSALGDTQNTEATDLAHIGNDIAGIVGAGGCPGLPQAQTVSAGSNDAAASVAALHGCVTALTTPPTTSPPPGTPPVPIPPAPKPPG